MMQSDETTSHQKMPWVNINHPNDQGDDTLETEGLIANAMPLDSLKDNDDNGNNTGFGSPNESNTNTNNGVSTRSGDDRETARVAGSGTAGCLVGCLIAGPICAAVAGASTAYLAYKEGPFGNLARAMGDVALFAKDSATDIEQRYQIGNTSKRLAAEAWLKVREIDHQNQICEKSREAIVKTSKSAMEYASQNKAIREGLETVNRGFVFVVEKVRGADPQPIVSATDEVELSTNTAQDDSSQNQEDQSSTNVSLSSAPEAFADSKND